MTRVFRWLKRLGPDDAALAAGLVLIWIGCSMVAAPLPYLVVGTLALAYWLAPIVVSLRGRR